MKVKEESEKVGLKFNIQKTKIMTSGPITSWQINGETMETVTFLFFNSKITADGDFSHENKRSLLLGRKAMTNLDLLKSRGSCHLQTVRVLLLLFQSGFVSFSSLIAVSRTSRNMLNNMVKVDTLVPFLIQGGMLSGFNHWE